MKRTLLLLLFVTLGVVSMAQKPKYVFYFIGDGMGFNHVALGGGDSLNFTRFPHQGALATRSLSDSITDSAAAGTALSTGEKTSNGTIAMNADHTQRLRSIAYHAQESGRRVGIITSVSLDHATPAAFYASAPSRKMAYEIAAQLPTTGFDLFAGSGFVDPKNLFQTFADSSYLVLRGKDAQLTGRKIIWIQDEGKNMENLPKAATERKADDLTLPLFTQGAIEFLSTDSTRGFFMMIEGGMIDWASHANNATQARGEVLDFAQAIARALAFYEAHSDETLIVVTADHETGGLRLNPVGWSSDYHTAARVPVFAIGQGAQQFARTMDNTQVASTIRAMF